MVREVSALSRGARDFLLSCKPRLYSRFARRLCDLTLVISLYSAEALPLTHYSHCVVPAHHQFLQLVLVERSKWNTGPLHVQQNNNTVPLQRWWLLVLVIPNWWIFTPSYCILLRHAAFREVKCASILSCCWFASGGNLIFLCPISDFSDTADTCHVCPLYTMCCCMFVLPLIQKLPTHAATTAVINK